MKNNKGFTLVELMVCVVIFSVVLTAAFGFMIAAARSYNRVNDRLEVQRKSQSALSLIEEYAIDCTTYTAYFDNTLCLVDKQGETYIVNLFFLGPATPTASGKDVLYYYQTEGTFKAGGTLDKPEYTLTFSKPLTGDKITDDVESFSLAKTGSPAKDALSADSVSVILGIKKGTAGYSCAANISLRNHPVVVATKSVGTEIVLSLPDTK